MADKNFGQPKGKYSFVSKGSKEDSRVLWSSYTPFNSNSKPTQEQTKAFEELTKSAQMVSNYKDDPGFNIWKRVDSGSNLQDMYGQHAIGSLNNLKPGDMLTFFDFENVGTAPHQRLRPDNLGWFSPLELAAQRVRVKDNYTLEHVGNGLSMVMRPTKEDQTQMQSLINKIKGMKGKTWTGLTSDEWRSANDLILYAHNNPFDETNGLFKIENGVTHIVRQNRLDQAADGTIFSSKHIKLMQKGLDNVMRHGNAPDVVARELLSYFRASDGSLAKLGGFNIKNFDVPMMMDWIDSRLAPKVKDSKLRKSLSTLRSDLANVQMIDSRQILNTVFKDKAERYGVNGLTQEGIADKRGLEKSAAHIGIVDVWTNIKVHNSMVEKDNLMGIVNGTHTGSIAKYNMDNILKGTQMYSLNGLQLDSEKGKWDNVLTMQDGKFRPLYDNFRIAPLSKDTNYSLHSKFRGTMADGKLYYTAIFHNQDTGNYHMIARENADDLRNIIHKSMVPMEEAQPYIKASQSLSRIDKARRSWDKMFSWESGGGRYLFSKYSKLHDIYNKYASEGIITKDMESKSVVRLLSGDEAVKGAGITPTMIRDYNEMKDRFGDEFAHINEFIGRLDRELPHLGKYTPRSHDIALKTYASLIDQSILGKNQSEFDLAPNRYSLNVTINGQNNNIDLSSQRSAYSGIRNSVDVANQSTSVIKQRLSELLLQAQAAGMPSSEVNKFRGMIEDLKNKQSPYVIIEQLSSYLHAKASTDATFGFKSATFDDPTKVVDARKRLLNDALFREELQTKSISHAQTFHGTPWKPSGNGINITDPTFRRLIDEHDSSVGKLFNHVIGKGGATSLHKMTAEETLGRMINAYAQDGIKAQIVYNAKTDAMHLVLANEETAKQVFGLQANEILEHAKVAHVAIPMLDGNGNIKMPGNTRIARSKIFELQDNKLGFGTAFEQAIFGINKRAKTAREMLKDGRSKDVSSMLKAAVREEVQAFSINNQYIDPEDMMRQDTRLSRTARYARSGHVDVTALAEKWYSWMYEQKEGTFNDKLRRKKERMEKDKSLSFYNTLSKDEAREFHITIDRFAQTFGLNTNMHNIKDVHALNGLRSSANASVQNLLPFGYLDQMGRENIVKHGNYLPFDRRQLEQNLDSGLRHLKPAERKARINRILNRGLMTDVGAEVLDGETAFLNLRTVYQDNNQIAARMSNAGMVDELASVYDGGIIIRDDVAKAFTTSREKKITLNEDAMLPSKIQDLFENSGMYERIEQDGKVSYALKKGYNVSSERNLLNRNAERVNKVGSAHHGHYTVGQISIDDTLQSSSYYEGQNQNVWIKGWNAEKNQLILETKEMMRGGVKIGSESGDRSTAIIRSREWFKQMGYQDSDEVVNAYVDAKKGMQGAKARAIVNYAIDSVHQAIDEDKITAETIKDAMGHQEFLRKGYTVGKMTKDEIRYEAMTMMGKLMHEQLGVREAKVLNKYQIQMNYDHAMNGENKVSADTLGSFVESVDAKFKTGISHGDASRGNVGYTAADVFNWENQVGYIKGRGKGGLVRWGDKEVGMIERRANQVLGDNNVVTKWLHNHVSKASIAQSGEESVLQYINGLSRTVYDATDKDFQAGRVGPKAGELIVSSHSDSFMYKDAEGNFKGERAGKETGRVLENGTHVVSTNAFHDLPEIIGPNDKMTVGKYHQTILRAGDVEVDFNGERKSLQGLIDSNGGTFLYQLPEGFSHSHVRMIDQKLVGLGAQAEEGAEDGRMPVLQRLQKAQLKLWRSVQDYNKEGAGPENKNRDRVQNAINDYHKEVAYLTDSAREGSISRISGAKMDMSGRFRSQGVNPFVEGGSIKEGEYIVGKDQFKRMINGAETDILHAVGGEHLEKYKKSKAYWDTQINKEKDAIRRGQLRDWLYGTTLEGGGRTRGRLDDIAANYVLDYSKDKGLYGIVGRYPTIETDTLNVLNIKWSDKVHGDNGIMGIATAFAMNDDHDGDFNSVVLAHYKREAGAPTGEEMHKALQKIQETSVNGDESKGLMGLNRLHDEIVNELKGKSFEGKLAGQDIEQLTIGQLMKTEGFRETFLPKVGKMYDLETAIARTGKGDVGPLDNLRLRMFNIANPVYDTLAKERGMDRVTAHTKISHIEEFGRIISQNAISSKKFTQQAVLQTMAKENPARWANADLANPEVESEVVKRMTADRYSALDDLVRGIQRGDNEGMEMVRRANDILDLFDKDASVDGRPLEQRINADQKYGLETMLDTVKELHNHVGNEGWVRSLFLVPGTSMGTGDIEKTGQVLRSQGGVYIPTPLMNHIKDAAKEAGNTDLVESMERGEDLFKRTVLTNHDRLNGNDNIFGINDSRTSIRDATNTADMIDTMTVAEGAGVKLRQVMGKVTGMTGVTGEHMRGAGWGAAAFGAMWAASAIVRGGPTPEGLQEQMSPPVPQTLQHQPTARVAMNNAGEHINLSINAKDAKGMSRDQIAAMVQSELGAQTQTQMNMNLNVNDNTQDLSNSQWLQGFVSNALDKGFGF